MGHDDIDERGCRPKGILTRDPFTLIFLHRIGT